jgi:hypothetical protein
MTDIPPSSPSPFFHSASLTISIQGQDLSIPGGGGEQTEELSFDSSDPTRPRTERSIKVATGLPYTLICRRNGFDATIRVWFRGDMVVSGDTTDRIYAMMPDSNTWNLEFRNFSVADRGRYSCRSSGEFRTLDVTDGKCREGAASV